MQLAEGIVEAIQKAMDGAPIRTTDRLNAYAMDSDPVRAFHLVVMKQGSDLHPEEVEGFVPREVVRGQVCYLVPKELVSHL